MKYLLILPILVLMLAGVGCSGSSNPDTAEDIGTLTLSMTDAPVDAGDIAGVYISITKVEIGDKASGEVEWVELADYSAAPKQLNLLDYTGGLAYEIGQFDIEAGTYNQIRFYLDATEEGQGAPTSPGCYIEFTDESTEPLFVPSGSNSGYKAVGAFEVAVNSDTEITVDFDVRKSLHVTGQGQNQRYILQPTLRLIVDSEAGNITGTVNDESGLIDIHPFAAYAYEDGDWNTDEYNTPDADGNYLMGAVTSTNVDAETGEFTLAYLAQDVDYIVVIVIFNAEDGTINEIPIVVDDEAQIQPLDQNTVNLGTLNTSDYEVIIPGIE